MSATRLIWDPFIRLYHVLIIVAFTLNYFILEPGETIHQWVGYVAVALVLMRIGWGFIGPQTARIADFFPTPLRLKQHLRHLRARQIPQREGHNAMGGMLILVFWLLFLAQGLTGFLLEETDRFFGSSLVEDIHELIAHALYAGALLHIAAVLMIGWWGRIALIRPMITGWRKPTD